MHDPLSTEIAAKATAALIRDVFSGAAQSVKKFSNWVADKAEERDVFGIAAHNYAVRMEKRYNVMRVLGMSEPLPLRDVYVRVNVLEKIRGRVHGSAEELEKHLRRDTRAFSIPIKTMSGDEVVASTARLLVLGKPGAGKTTFLKHLIFEAFDGKLTDKLIPVFISLKDWSERKSTSGDRVSLFDYIVEEFDVCNLPDADPFVEHLLKQGRCLILLDGLDEITGDINEAIRMLRIFSDKYDNNCFVLSCRIAAYNYVFERFTDVEMADFNEKQIERFISNFFKNQPETAEKCWKELKAHPPTKELASVPLLLVLLCIAFDETYFFPTNRADLYRQAIDALLVKWDASRRIRRDRVYQNLTLRRKEQLLSQLAYKTFKEGRYFVDQRVLEEHIAVYIENLPEVDDASLMPQSAVVLQSIEAQHGLLIQRSRTVYSFSHLTIQEYFTARYIVDQKHDALPQLVDSHFIDMSWTEVMLLMAGMLPDATNLVLMMRRQLRTFARNQGLDQWLVKVNGCVNPTSACPVSVSQCVAIFLVFYLARNLVYDRDRTLLHARTLAQDQDIDIECALDLALDLAVEYDHYSGRDHDRDLDSALGFAHDLAHTFDSTLFHTLDRALFHTLNRAHVLAFELDNNRNHELYQAQDLDRSLDLAHDFVLDQEPAADLDDEHIYTKVLSLDSACSLMQDLVTYLMGSQILLRCLGTSYYVQKLERERLLKKILWEPWEESSTITFG